jgi:hypothetical protein
MNSTAPRMHLRCGRSPSVAAIGRDDARSLGTGVRCGGRGRVSPVGPGPHLQAMTSIGGNTSRLLARHTETPSRRSACHVGAAIGANHLRSLAGLRRLRSCVWPPVAEAGRSLSASRSPGVAQWPYAKRWHVTGHVDGESSETTPSMSTACLRARLLTSL